MKKWFVTDVKETNPAAHRRAMPWHETAPSSRQHSVTPLQVDMQSGQKLLSQQVHAVETGNLLFFFFFSFLSSGTEKDNGCYFIRQVIGKVDRLDEWMSILAVKRINTGVLGEPSRDAIPRG